MRRLSDLPLPVACFVSVLGAAGCSASPENGGSGSNDVQPFGNQPSDNAMQGTGTNGQSGSTGAPIGGNGQGGNEGNPSAVNGTAGTASSGAAGSSAMGGPVVDIVSEPGPGFFSSGAWRGYAWTAIETDPVVGATTRIPVDFTAHPDKEPFCLSGVVAADPPDAAGNNGYQGFAMLGFNINQAGVSEVEGTEPPVGTAVPTGTGLALTFSQTQGPLRVQIQGADPTDPAQRWCAAVPPPDAQGRTFIEYTSFHQTCYLEPPLPAAGFYGAGGVRAPIAAVSFLVPGAATETTPFDFCVAGFADGNAVEDAPTSDNFSGGGLISGIQQSNFRRNKVRGRDGKSYVVQNNVWNPGAAEGSQHLQFEGNSFTITQQSNGGFGNIPISFPSIFVGRNGFRGVNEEFTTTEDDGLPRVISAINRIDTTFIHNGGAGPGGEYNVTYDIWFANSPPQGEYEDASAAFLMVWLHKPGGKNPIGLNPFVRGVSIQGAPGTWDIWVGRRGENGAENNLNDNAPVISYTPSATIGSFQANLMSFINDAVSRSNAGALNGFSFGSNLVLTDIFGGSEIWSGGQGLQVSEFTVNVVGTP